MRHRSRIIKHPAPSTSSSSDQQIPTKSEFLDNFDADCYFKSELKETLLTDFQTQSRLDRNLLLGTLDQEDKKATRPNGR